MTQLPSDRPLSLTKFTIIRLFEVSSRFYEVKKTKHTSNPTRALKQEQRVSNSIPPRARIKISFHWAFKITVKTCKLEDWHLLLPFLLLFILVR